MVETVHAQWTIAKIGEKQRRTAKISTSYRKSIFGEIFKTRSRVSALTAHAQTLSSQKLQRGRAQEMKASL